MQSKRNNYYDATIRRMVQESMVKKNEEFCKIHEDDADEALLDYLKATTRELGHSPHDREILGADLICQRFGNWESALTQAELPLPTTPNKLSNFKLWTDEAVEQKQVYAQRKAIKKQRARIREAQWAKRNENNKSD